MAVLVGVAHPDALARGKFDQAGALHLQEKQLHGVRHPRQRLCRQCRRGRVDFGARVIGHEAPALDAAPQAQVAQLGVHLAEVDHDQVIGDCVNRETKCIRLRALAPEDGLVIPRDQAFVAPVRGNDAKGRKVFFEEGPRAGFGLRSPARLLARRLPRLPRLHAGASGNECPQAWQHRCLSPGRNVAPRNRFVTRIGRRRLGRNAGRARRAGCRSRAGGGRGRRTREWRRLVRARLRRGAGR